MNADTDAVLELTPEVIIPSEVLPREVLLVKIGDLLGCVDLANVVRTISLVDIQAMPGSAHYVVGIMNYAGSSLPVIDLAIRMGLSSSPYTLDTPIMVCEHEGQRIAVIVQDIVGIQTLSDQDKQLTRKFDGCKEAFQASAHTELGLALLLDVSWLMGTGFYPTVGCC